MSGPVPDAPAIEAPPEPPAVERPERVSQTLLRHFTECHRSAALYMARPDDGGSHPKHRGIVFHTFAETAVRLMIENEEPRIPEDVAKDLMNEALVHHDDLAVPADEADWLRIMAFHFAEGVWIEPGTVLAIEQLVHLQIGDYTLTGRIDLVLRYPDGSLAVWDWKTNWNVPSQEDFERSFQTPLYAVLLAEGIPVERKAVPCVPCHGTGAEGLSPGVQTLCPECKGRGEVSEYVPGFEPLGSHAPAFELRNLYPRYYKPEFGLTQRETVVERGRVQDHRLWLEVELQKFDKAFDRGTWPATDGSHCGECPQRSACPLPAIRQGDWEGFETLAEAQEGASAWLHTDARRGDLWKKLRAFGSLHGPIPFGENLVLDFRHDVSESIKDKEKLKAAITRAVEYGEEFVPADHWKKNEKSTFRKRQQEPGEFVGSTTEGESNGRPGAGED